MSPDWNNDEKNKIPIMNRFENKQTIPSKILEWKYAITEACSSIKPVQITKIKWEREKKRAQNV